MKTYNFVVGASLAIVTASAVAFADFQGDVRVDPPQISPAAGRTVIAANTTTDQAKTKMENGLQATEDTVRKAVDRAGNAIEGTYKKIKAAFIGSDDMTRSAGDIYINENMTAEGIIGQPIYDQDHKRVDTVSDIILDAEGNARFIVFNDGGFAGLGGKLVALNYDAAVNRTNDGDMVMPVSKETIKSAAEFSYKAETANNVMTMPANGYSVKRILKGDILGSDGKDLGDVENISFLNGRANYIIADYKMLSVGGDKVALEFSPSLLVRDGKDADDINVKLSAAQTERFKNYKGHSGGKMKVGKAN